MSRPEVVCLDAGHTLFTERLSRAEMYARVFARFGAALDTSVMAAWMEAVHEELPERVGGHVRYSDGWFREFITRLLHRAGSPIDPEPVRAALANEFTRPESYVVFADTFPALDDLASAGHRLALVSNWSGRLNELLERLGMRSYFEVLAISAEVGASKPDARLFQHALARLQVPPERALHVGDHALRDLAGARQAGLSALLIDRGSGARVDMDTITSLTELSARLAG